MSDTRPAAGPTESAMPERMNEPIDDGTPGVPGFRSWRGVYLFVFACFVLTVVLLAIFTRVFA